jgi:hypothetical protein
LPSHLTTARRAHLLAYPPRRRTAPRFQFIIMNRLNMGAPLPPLQRHVTPCAAQATGSA